TCSLEECQRAALAFVPQPEQIFLATDDAEPVVADDDAAARPGRFGEAELRDELAIVDHALDQDLDAAAALLAAEQACRNHARVVEHQQIAGLEQSWQIAHR